jgi:restriction system protein
MAQINLPTSTSLLEAVVKAVKDSGGKATNQQIHDIVVKDLSLTKEQVDAIHSGNRTELDYRLAWARTNAKRKGLLVAAGYKLWALP